MILFKAKQHTVETKLTDIVKVRHRPVASRSTVEMPFSDIGKLFSIASLLSLESQIIQDSRPIKHNALLNWTSHKIVRSKKTDDSPLTST